MIRTLIFVGILSGLSAILTWYLSDHLFGPILACGSVGMIGSFLPRVGKLELSSLVYCGTFVGMTSPLVLPSGLFIAASGAIAGILFVFLMNYFKGVGGKLGSIAFISVCALIIFIRVFHG